MLTVSEKALAAWFHDEGGRIDGAVIGEQNGLRGMVATRDLARGEVVMRVPRHMILTLDTARHSAIGLRLLESAGRSEHTVMGVFLAHTRRHGGYWRPMVDTMPTAFDERLLHFSHADRALLKGTLALKLARLQWRRVRAEFRCTKAALPPAQRFSLREFLWGYEAAVTRSFGLSLGGNRIGGMVPYADMFNHASDRNCDWGGDHTQAFEVYTRRPVAAGTPLTITYGKSSNARLLAQYGFCVDHARYETAEIAYWLERGHWLHDFAGELTGRRGPQLFEVNHLPKADDLQRLFSFLRLWSLPGRDAARACADLGPPGFERVPPISLANEQEALRRLADGCEHALAGFSCGVDDDDALLAEGTLTPSQHHAVVARRSEKRALLKTLEQARGALIALYLPQAERRTALARRAGEGEGPWGLYLTQLLRLDDDPAAGQQRWAA